MTKSIQKTILICYFTLFLTALFFFLIISLKYTEKSIIHNSTEYTKQLTQQVNSNIDYYITYMEDTTKMIANSIDVKNYLFQTESKEARAAQYARILGQFKTIMNSRADIRNVAVISDDGQNVINRGTSWLNPYIDITEHIWHQEVQAGDKEFVLSSSHVQNVIAERYDWVITLSRALYRADSDEAEGICFIDLNYNTIDDLCQNVSLGDKGYIYVLDDKGGIIYHPQQQLLYSNLKAEVIDRVIEEEKNGSSFVEGKRNSRRVYTMSKSEKTGWTVVGVSYMSELMKEKNHAKMLYLFIVLVLLLATGIVTVWLSRAITSPIKELIKSMQEVEKGNFNNVEIENMKQNEIGALSKSYNIMIREIQNLMEQNLKEQRQKRKAEMKAFQSQINPHLIYNTLDSIIWMAESGKHNNKVVLMTSSLAKLLRRSIGNEEEMVSIRKELDYTETYLVIQSMRYQDKLEFDIQVVPQILDQVIVKFTLQPLVENAIYHGIKYKEGKGIVKIRGWRQEDEIVLQVIDNGRGMEPEERDHVLDKRKKTPKSNGVGVYNVHNRLQLYYGKEYGLIYESEIGIGTTVTIRIPREEVEYYEL